MPWGMPPTLANEPEDRRGGAHGERGPMSFRTRAIALGAERLHEDHSGERLLSKLSRVRAIPIHPNHGIARPSTNDREVLRAGWPVPAP